MPKLCIARTATGSRCQKEALLGSNYCSIHKRSATRHVAAKKSAKKSPSRYTVKRHPTKKAAKKTAKKK